MMNTTTLIGRQDEASKYLVYAKLDNAKVLYNLAKSVNFKEVLIFLNLMIIIFYSCCSFETDF